jgi:hypothetical protein
VTDVQAWTTAEREERIYALIAELDFRSYYGQRSEEEAQVCLYAFSDTALSLIEKASSWNKSQGRPRFRFMFHVITELDEQSVREVMFYWPHYLHDLDTAEAIGIVKGLRLLDRFKGTTSLEKLTGVDLETAIAFLNVTATLDEDVTCECLESAYVDDSNDESIFINKKELHDLIVDHYDKADQISNFIRERDTTDAAVIREYLESHAALNTGTL